MGIVGTEFILFKAIDNLWQDHLEFSFNYYNNLGMEKVF